MGNVRMYGDWIGKDDLPVQAVRQLPNGVYVFMLYDGGKYTKMVTMDNSQARYYEGTIAQFDPLKWNVYAKADGHYKLREIKPQSKFFQYDFNGKCTDRNGTVIGGVPPLSNPPTEHLVQFACANDPKCTGYSYSNGQYVMHNLNPSVDIGGGNGEANWKCKPKAAVGPCRTADGKLPPWKNTVNTFEECATSCLKDPACTGYAYDSSRRLCQQYGNGTGEATAPANAPLTSSVYTMPLWSCYAKGGATLPVATPAQPAAPVVPSAAPIPPPLAPPVPVLPAAPAPAPVSAPAAVNDVWTNQGCWQDGGPAGGQASMRAIGPDMVKVNSLDECKTYAKSKGANVIGLQNSNECYYGKDSDYKKYGNIPAERCNPKGDAWINNVWTLGAPPPVVSTVTPAPLTPSPGPAPPSGPELKDDWQCVRDFSAPVKRFGNDVGCLTSDGRSCLYGYCADPNSKFPADGGKPLICGSDYSSKYGITGYEDPGNWCSKVNAQLPQGRPANMPISQPVPQPAPQPFTNPFMMLGEGLCRTNDGLYPAFEQRTISEQECSLICQNDTDCMGYAYARDGNCQLYNTKTATVARTAREGDTIDRPDGTPSWKCNVKVPKVSIPIMGATGKLPGTANIPQVQAPMSGLKPGLPIPRGQVQTIGSLSSQLYNLPVAANCGSYFS